jgi:hypothetical protein
MKKKKNLKKLIILLVFIVLGLIVKKIVYGATYVTPIYQTLKSDSVQTMALPVNNSLLQGCFNADTCAFQDNAMSVTGELRYITVALSNISNGLNSLRLSGLYNLTAPPQQVGWANLPVITLDITDLPKGTSECNLVTFDLGQTFNFSNGGLQFTIDNNSSGNYSVGVCGSYTAVNNNFQSFFLTQAGYSYYYISPPSFTPPYNNSDTNLRPYFILDNIAPVIAPDATDLAITINSDKIATITGLILNNAVIPYPYIYLNLYNWSNEPVELGNASGNVNGSTNLFSITLGAVPAGNYRAKFQLAYEHIITDELATSYDFVLSEAVPPNTLNSAGTPIPAGEYKATGSPSTFYITHSTYTTPTGLYTNVTEAIYPVLNSIGNWSISFNSKFDLANALVKGNGIGTGIATVFTYGNNINSFFGNVPVVEALGIYIIFQLALAMLASIRFIIKLIK